MTQAIPWMTSFFAALLLLGGVLWFVMRKSAKLALANMQVELGAQLTVALQKLEAQQTVHAMLEQRMLEEQANATQLREAHQRLDQLFKTEQDARIAAEAKAVQLLAKLEGLEKQVEVKEKQFAEKLAFVEEAKQNLVNQFKSLANDILEEKSKRFTEQNQNNLGHLLNPLKSQISEFKAKVETAYDQEGKERIALQEQVKQLIGLNQVLSEDAKNLTTALKGNNKMQGNWGELVLETILQSSGLRRGAEYQVQASHTDENGRRLQPDVIIHMPEGRSLVVDSKMSLNAYADYINAAEDDDVQSSLKRHIQSIRSHIKGLSSKQYQQLHQLKTLDFVLMFVPVESAFLLAVGQDSNLYQDAWKEGVLLVSPSTLMFVLRTVEHLWRQEQQNKNAQEIAKRGAELYDRLCDFVKELNTVGDRLRQAQDSFNDAHKKLTQNKGNVIRQAEMLRELGVKPKKSLPYTAVAEDQGDDGQELPAILPQN